MEYKGYEIKETQDFGLRAKGETGYIIVKDYCNVGPGGVYFKSVKEAQRGIDIFIQAGGGTPDYNNDYFWDLLQKRWTRYIICEHCGEMVYSEDGKEALDDVTTVTDLRCGHRRFEPHKCRKD